MNSSEYSIQRAASARVYHQIEAEGLLSRRRLEVYKTLFRIGPATANEVASAAGQIVNPAKGDNSHARLRELEELNCVEPVGERVCRVTGRLVTVWDVTSKLPVVKPRQSEVQRLEVSIKKLYSKIGKLQARLLSLRHKQTQEFQLSILDAIDRKRQRR